jgi:hypothetical protein
LIWIADEFYRERILILENVGNVFLALLCLGKGISLEMQYVRDVRFGHPTQEDFTIMPHPRMATRIICAKMEWTKQCSFAELL